MLMHRLEAWQRAWPVHLLRSISLRSFSLDFDVFAFNSRFAHPHPINTHVFTNDNIVAFYENHVARHRKTLNVKSSGGKILELTADTVVKFSLGVTVQEACAQTVAFEQIDHEILRVPRSTAPLIDQTRNSGSIGYLVMEKIDGVTLEQIGWEGLDMPPRVVAALNTINSIQGKIPGPASGGEAHGSLWPEYGSGKAFCDIKALEDYLNERLE